MQNPRDLLPPGVRHVVRGGRYVWPWEVVPLVRRKGRVGRVGEGEDAATAATVVAVNADAAVTVADVVVVVAVAGRWRILRVTKVGI